MRWFLVILAAASCGNRSVLVGEQDAGRDEDIDLLVPDTPEAVEGGDTGGHGDDDLSPDDYEEHDAYEETEFFCETDRYLPADNLYTPYMNGPYYVFETPEGFAWVYPAPDPDAWSLMKAPATFDSIDGSTILEGLPATTTDGGTVPLYHGRLPAVYSEELDLVFLLLSDDGISNKFYGAFYGLDGLPRSPLIVIADEDPFDLDHYTDMLAPLPDGFAYLFCGNYDPETFCQPCQVEKIEGDGSVAGPFTVSGQLGIPGVPFWNEDGFVFIDYSGCAERGMLRWRGVSLDGSMGEAVDIITIEEENIIAPIAVSINGSEVGVYVSHLNSRWGRGYAISLMRLDRSGNLLLPPVEIFRPTLDFGSGSTWSEPGRGYALLQVDQMEITSRIVFKRIAFDGSVRQETLLRDYDFIGGMSAGPLFWRDDHFVAEWGFPPVMGSLVCR